MSQTEFGVVGIGNAIVDVLGDADDGFLARHGMPKGAMTLIDTARAEQLYTEMKGAVECSGGSAANTIAGFASLGGQPAFIGKVRDDALGQVFAREIRASGVTFDTTAATAGPPTGRCLIFVTPDAQRTMQTFLGVSATLSPEDVHPETVAAARITFLEGYLWEEGAAKEAFLRAASLAHDAGRKVALTLSDPFCVERHRAEFRDLVEHHIDILFANEVEALSLYETTSFDEAVRRLQGHCEVAAVTRSAEGSVVLANGKTEHFPAEPVDRVVDTTGAGDLYAAGFLFGLSSGADTATCARLASIAAGEIISHYGARPETSLQQLVRTKMERAG